MKRSGASEPPHYAIESRPPSWASCFDPRGLVTVLARHRDLIVQLIRRNVSGRYQGSFLGNGWTVLQPLLLLAVYTYVFGVVFQARWRADAAVGHGEFALTLFCGMIPFGLISESASNATGVIVGNAGYVKRVVFPLEVLPLVVVGSALVTAGINTLILLAAHALLVGPPPATALLLPVAAVPCVLLALTASWVLAALGVFVRDTASVVAFVLQLLFFMTPILYPSSAVPERFRALVHANPLAALVEAWRALALGITTAPWLACVVITAVAGVLALAGRALFLRAQGAFADVV
jgi:lipopolysaccharide transport system permease protein